MSHGREVMSALFAIGEQYLSYLLSPTAHIVTISGIMQEKDVEI